MCDFANYNNCAPTQSGTTRYVYAIPAEEVISFPQSKAILGPPASVVAGDTKRLGGPFQYVTTTKKGFWRKIKIVIMSGKVDQNMVGEGATAGIESMFAFKLADDSAEARELADQFIDCSKCDGFFFAVENPESGDRDIIGTTAFPAVLKTLGMTSGEGVGKAARESTFVVSSLSGKAAMVYPKALALNTTPNP